MSVFPSLPDDASLEHVLQRFPHAVPPLLEYHDRLLRDHSPLTVAERELIAAYVSGLNGCTFCFGAHSLIAEAFGVDREIFETLMSDLDAADIDPKLKPLLAYVRKLTLTPTRITEEDAAAVYDAGWDEQALFDAISVCALFNFMNRIVEGSGVKIDLLKAPSDLQAEFSSKLGGSEPDPHQSRFRYSDILGAEK